MGVRARRGACAVAPCACWLVAAGTIGRAWRPGVVAGGSGAQAARVSARVVAARPGARRRRPVRRPRASCVAGAGWRGGRGRRAGRRCAGAGSAASWVRSGELAVERELLGPGDQVLGDQRELQPDGVVVEVAEREVLQAGLLGGADAVLGAGAGAVQALELDRVAGQVGQGGQEAVAVVVCEGQLGAGVRALAAHDHPRALGPALRSSASVISATQAPSRVSPSWRISRPPRRLGQREDRVADRLGQIEAHQEVDVRRRAARR